MAAIAEVAHGFMSTFSDMVVTTDDVSRDSDRTKFHWTLIGTNTGPGGTGKRVRISGYELWKSDNDGLIGESKGRFDSAELRTSAQARSRRLVAPLTSHGFFSEHDKINSDFSFPSYYLTSNNMSNEFSDERKLVFLHLKDALEQLSKTKEETAIVEIQDGNIKWFGVSTKDASKWLREKGHEDSATLLETPSHPVFFKAVIVNAGGITIAHQRRAGQ